MLKKYIGLNFLILSLFLFDRMLKLFFIQNPSKMFGGDFSFVGFSFHLVKNSGVAFGIHFNQIFLLVLITSIILILVRLLVKAYGQKDLILILSLTLIVVGAASNLIDRLRYRFVVDYIDMPFFTVFNLADAMISLGVGIMIVYIFKDKKNQLSKS